MAVTTCFYIEPPLRQRILTYVEYHRWSSASQVAKALKEKTSSVASILKKMADQGTLVRKDGYGPRGGYGYSLPGPSSQPLTCWERVLEDWVPFGE